MVAGMVSEGYPALGVSIVRNERGASFAEANPEHRPSVEVNWHWQQLPLQSIASFNLVALTVAVDPMQY